MTRSLNYSGIRILLEKARSKNLNPQKDKTVIMSLKRMTSEKVMKMTTTTTTTNQELWILNQWGCVYKKRIELNGSLVFVMVSLLKYLGWLQLVSLKAVKFMSP